MQKTITAILSDTSVRKDDQVVAKLSSEFSAGFPWWNAPNNGE